MDELTYPEVGATRQGDLPAGYRMLRYRTTLPAGSMHTAADAVLGWHMHRAAGVRVRASDDWAAPGVRVTCGLGVGPLRLNAPCEVVWAEHGERFAGFGYGTLPGHPARGEEAFIVESDGTRVTFTVLAFSVPARWFMRAAGPVAGVFQRAYAANCGRALRRLCR